MSQEGEAGLIEAEARVFRPEEGGRRMPIFSGYRPNLRDAGLAEAWRGMGFVQIVGADTLEPGSTGMITITTVPQTLWLGLEAGSRLDMCEGPKVVAYVTVHRVVREPTADW